MRVSHPKDGMFLFASVVVASVVVAFAAVAAEPAATAPVGAAGPKVERLQVLVELTDTPALRVYEAELAASTGAEPAARQAAARAAERAQDRKIKEAQASLSKALAGLGARELYRVRRSFNGIGVLVSPEKLPALRELAGVKAIYPRRPLAESGPPRVARTQATPAAPGPPSAVSSSGRRAYRDPETGRLTASPTDAEVSELDRLIDEALDDSTEGLEVQTAPDGSLYLDLQGRFQSVSLATVEPNGRVRLLCTDRPLDAKRRLLDPAASPAEEE
jgi:hypothetical protein